MLRNSLTAVLAVLALLAQGCGPDPVDPTNDACSGRLAGDLVISEFMANPAGEDSGKEYIEIYNATSAPASLEGVTLRVSRKDGSAEKKVVLKQGAIAPGSYYVLGDVRDGAPLPGHVDDTYAASLGALSNTDGKIAVLCGTTVIDEITYATVKENTSRVFDGTTAPDAQANDDEARWCNSPKTTGDFLGSPRAANASCQTTGSCALGVGSLVITEFMANPPGTDDGNEWIELFNGSGVTLDLEGVTLRFTRLDGSAKKEVKLAAASLSPGRYYVVGDVRGETLPAHVNQSYGTGLGALSNTDGILSLHCGLNQLDAVSYSQVKDGASRIFDGASAPDAAANDDESRWCHSPTQTGDFFGSPGAANSACPASQACTVTSAGALVITEFMANPTGTDDGNEWIELYNDSGDALQLAGLTLRYTRLDGSSKKEVKLGEAMVSAGEYVVLGDVRTGPLPAHVDLSYGSGLGALGNTDGVISVHCDTTQIDAISYTAGKVKDGASRAFDGAAAPDAAANDDESSWCDATVDFGTGKGSPGSANEACGSVAVGCIDSTTGMARPLNPPQPERLIFTEVMPAPATPQGDREWMELLALDDMDLNGVLISRGTQTGTASTRVSISSEECIAITAGSFVVLARKSDPSVNGGIAAPIHTFGFSLVDNDTLFASHGGTLLDRATYTNPGAKKSAQLSNDRLEAWVNDSPYAWCSGDTSYNTDGGGELGTPGLPNRNCASPVAPGECRDNLTGQPRNIRRPVAGDLAFTEVMPAPTPDTVGTDRPKEWFELLVLNDFDLNEVQITNASGGGTPFTVQQALCHEVSNGAYLLFAQTTAAGSNGGLPTPNFVFDFDLFNAGSGANPQRAVIVRSQGTELDRLSWTTSTVGASIQLTSSVTPSPSANDVLVNLCDTPAGNGYGTGTDLGTPGQPNVACP